MTPVAPAPAGQPPVADPHTVDFACLDARLIVELDGSQHAEFRRVAVRDAWLGIRNYRILRVWNAELSHARAAVLDAVWYALQTQGDHS